MVSSTSVFFSIKDPNVVDVALLSLLVTTSVSTHLVALYSMLV